MRIMLVTNDDDFADEAARALSDHRVTRMARAQAVSVGSVYDAVVLEADGSGTPVQVAESLRERRCARRAILLGEPGQRPTDPRTTVIPTPFAVEDLVRELETQPPPAVQAPTRRRRARARVRSKGFLGSLTELITTGDDPTPRRAAPVHRTEAVDAAPDVPEVPAEPRESPAAPVEAEAPAELPASSNGREAPVEAPTESTDAEVSLSPSPRLTLPSPTLGPAGDRDEEVLTSVPTNGATHGTNGAITNGANGVTNGATSNGASDGTAEATTNGGHAPLPAVSLQSLLDDPDSAPYDPRVEVIAVVLEAEARAVRRAIGRYQGPRTAEGNADRSVVGPPA